MQINSFSNSNNPSFKSITPIIANKGMLQVLKKHMVRAQKTNYMIVDVTKESKIYDDVDGIFGWAKYKQKDMGLFIVGDDFVKCKNKVEGWRTKKDVMKKINRTPAFLTPESNGLIRELMARVDRGSKRI